MTFEDLIRRARTLLSFDWSTPDIIITFMDEGVEPVTAVFAVKAAKVLLKDSSVI
jgi:predicted fused transcriptional regulator/phosphomethylpyrimidine kinase